MRATILRASTATSGRSGINAPGMAVEAELSNGSNVRLYVRDGWAFDNMAINGQLQRVDPDIMDTIEDALALYNKPICLDMSYPEYLNWVPGCVHDYRLGSFTDWQNLNGINEG